MKLRLLILVGILAIGLPMILLAQSTTGTDNTNTIGGCMVVAPGNTEVETLTNKLACVYNLVLGLNEKVKNLENRISVLESKGVPGIPVPTTPPIRVCPSGCTCSGDAITCPAISPTETKAIQRFLKEEGSFTYPTATGNYGTITKEAVRKFQTKQGLRSTGLIDQDTLDKMKTLATTVAPSTSTSLQQVVQ